MTRIHARPWVAIGALTALAVTVACEDATLDPPAQTGTRVLLTDAPFPFGEVERVDVFIVRVDAAETADTTLGQTWTNVVEPRRAFNLLEFQRGATAFVGDGDLPAGVYEAVRVIIDTEQSAIVMTDGRIADVRWPVAGQLALHAFVEEPVDVAPAGGSIVIDFDVGRSFQFILSDTDTLGTTPPDRFIFAPIIRAVNPAGTGDITGTVFGDLDGDGTAEPIAMATVNVLRVDRLAIYSGWLSSGTTDADGKFRIAYLLPATYLVEASAPGLPITPATQNGIEVVRGETATVDLELGQPFPTTLAILAPDRIDVGQAADVRAAVLDQDGDTIFGAPVSWSIGPPGLASLADPAGGPPTGDRAVLTGLAQGRVSIQASSGTASDSVSVRIAEPDEPPVNSVELSPATVTIARHDSVFVAVILRDAQGNVLSNRDVAWSVSDSTVLGFNGAGPHGAAVIGLAAGRATLRATSEGVSGTATVTVNQ